MRLLIRLLAELGPLTAPAAILRGRHACPHRCGWRTRTPNRVHVHLYIDHYGEPLP